MNPMNSSAGIGRNNEKSNQLLVGSMGEANMN